jgi:ketosteroid isomerase-like protein
MTETAFTALLAENAIRRLIAAYCDAVGRRDADAAGALFAPDCAVRIANGPERTGRDVQIEGMRQSFASFSFLHQRCDHGLIDVDGVRAKARLSVFEVCRKHDAGDIALVFGSYQDNYALLGEGWRFQRRHYSLQMRATVPFAKIQELPGVVPEHFFAV